MIVQSSPEGQPRLVIKMIEHSAFAGRLARAFGNEGFEPVAPRAEMLFVIDHHDWGWREFDESPGRDPATGLPWNLLETPREIGLQTLHRSPDFNEAHHPFCGLLATMHMWGLYMGRYGLSDQRLVELVPATYRRRFDDALDRLQIRQEQLERRLAGDPGTEAWVRKDRLLQCYKQLQFFDALALYFNLHGPAERGPVEFRHVPRTPTEYARVEIRPRDNETYQLDPFPFRESGVRVSFSGRHLMPIHGNDADLAQAMRRAPKRKMWVRLVAA